MKGRITGIIMIRNIWARPLVQSELIEKQGGAASFLAP
jgi:hypothetical protein